MKILLDRVGRSYQRRALFQDVSGTITAGAPCAILGRNGSGKSTLLRILAAMQRPTSGRVFLEENEKSRPVLYSDCALCAPGMDLPEELTIAEFLKFHFAMKASLRGMPAEEALEETGLTQHRHKQLGALSSGMKQRVKLIQAFASAAPILLLDEPCTNLDDAGVVQYRDWCQRFGDGKILVIASNDPREYDFCTQRLQLS